MKKRTQVLELRSKRELDKLRRLQGIQDMKAVVHAFKYSNHRNKSPCYDYVRPIFQYRRGAIMAVRKPDKDPSESCGAGVNVATLAWVRQRICRKDTVWRVAFRVKDIAVIPFNTDGKLRLYRCKVVKKEFTK
jgi:hypothetical protein